jgi:hypothetical protein
MFVNKAQLRGQYLAPDMLNHRLSDLGLSSDLGKCPSIKLLENYEYFPQEDAVGDQFCAHVRI